MLTVQNVESELSYALLHAIAARAGFSCEVRNRHADGAGVDATLMEDGRKLAADSVLTSFEVHVQLKATARTLPEEDGCLSYPLKVDQYDKLRSGGSASPRILVLLSLPAECKSWLEVTEDSVVGKRSLYWVSLRGAPASPNRESQTVYIPRRQLLTPDGLNQLMTRFSRREEVRYDRRDPG